MVPGIDELIAQPDWDELDRRYSEPEDKPETFAWITFRAKWLRELARWQMPYLVNENRCKGKVVIHGTGGCSFTRPPGHRTRCTAWTAHHTLRSAEIRARRRSRKYCRFCFRV